MLLAYWALCLLQTPNTDFVKVTAETQTLQASDCQHPEGRIEQNHFETSLFRIHQTRLLIERHTNANPFCEIINSIQQCQFFAEPNKGSQTADLFLINSCLLI